MVQDLDIARWRLRSQHVVSPFAVSARAAVGSLLAVQAENFSQAAWAVASRTENPDQADLATLLDDAEGDEDAGNEMAMGFPTCALAVFTYDGAWSELDEASASVVAFHVGRG